MIDGDRFLGVKEAAEFCGFTTRNYRKPEIAFLKWVRRTEVPRGYAGRSLRFRRSHLLMAVQPTTKARNA